MTPGYLLLIKILIGLGLLVGAVFTWNAYTASLVAKGDKAGYARAQEEYRGRELMAMKAVRAQEQAKTAAVQKEVEDARKQNAALETAHAGAVAAGDRLRAQLAAAGRRGGPCARPAAPGGSPAADPTDSLLADVQRRLGEAEDATIRFADQSHAAGLTCQRIYEAVK
jgi:hypothetical protein